MSKTEKLLSAFGTHRVLLGGVLAVVIKHNWMACRREIPAVRLEAHSFGNRFILEMTSVDLERAIWGGPHYLIKGCEVTFIEMVEPIELEAA